MANHINRKWLFWLLFIVAFFAFLYAIKAILLPFVVGMLVAYFLDPAADRLEAWGVSRTGATLIISLLFFGIITLALILLAPVVYAQLSSLLSALPGFVAEYRVILDEQLQKVMSMLGDEELDSAKKAVSDSSSNVAAAFTNLSKNILNSGAALVNLASLVIITPIVSFYMLRDWDRLVAHLDTLWPRPYVETIREQLGIIDQTISGFVRGVVNVMLVLGTFYAIGLSIVGLDFAILIGVIGGIAIIIPYIGTIVSGGLAVGVAYLQFDSMTPVLVTLAIFTAGQMLEGYILTPKLVGDKIGLHPLWLIFGMLVGATLFGFVGIFLAIPVTAIIGVLSRFAIKQYKRSDLYDASEQEATS